MAAALAQLEAAEGGYLSEGEALQATKEELLRMKRLVEALLVLAREGRVTPVPLDLAALAREEARAFGVPYRGPETLPYEGDPLLLAQALRNLLRNAFLHGEGKGVEVRLSQEGEDLVLEVRDEGPGMPEEALKEAGRPFSGPPPNPGRAWASPWPRRWPRPTGVPSSSFPASPPGSRPASSCRLTPG